MSAEPKLVSTESALKPLVLLASLVKLENPRRMVMFLIDKTEVFLRPRHTDVKQAPCLPKTCRRAVIALARDIAGIDAIHDDGVELPALGAMKCPE